MPAAFVQKVLNSPGGTPASVTATGSAVGNGNLVVGTVTWASSPITTPDIKDNLGVSATIIDNDPEAGGPTTTITFMFVNVTNGMTGVVFTPPSAQGNTAVEWQEVSGAATTSPLDGHGLALNATNSLTQTTPTITTTVPGDYIYCCCFGTTTGSSPITAAGGTGASFTLRNNDNVLDVGGDSNAIQAAAGNVNGTFTLSTTAQQYINGIVAIKAAAGGGNSSIRQQNFKIDKFKTPARSMGPKAGLFQVKAFPISAPLADVPISY